MFGINQISSKPRFFIFLAALSTALIIVYKIALGVTINLLSENIELSEKLDKLNTSMGVSSDNVEENYCQNFIIPSDSNLFFKNKLFGDIEHTSEKYNIVVIDYSSLKDFTTSNGIIQTQKTILSGDYVSLLKSLNYIEELKLRYKLNSIRLIKTKNLSSKTDELLLELIFQVIVKN